MATRTFLLFAALGIGVGLGVGAGCQSPDRQANLPAPNFGAPDITNPTAPVAALPPVSPPVRRTAKPPVQGAKPPAVVSAGNNPKDWVPAAPARAWKYIVIHHSDTTTGSAARFDKFHKDKGWDELGYHFVVGNGTESRDGQVEIGPRWPKQKWGAHCKTPDNRYNDFGIGICLVGNFDQGRPTSAQMQATTRLVAYLMKTYKISADNVIGHGDAKATDCPGKYMDVALLRRQAAALAADDGWTPDRKSVAAGEELLQSIR